MRKVWFKIGIMGEPFWTERWTSGFCKPWNVIFRATGLWDLGFLYEISQFWFLYLAFSLISSLSLSLSLSVIGLLCMVVCIQLISTLLGITFIFLFFRNQPVGLQGCGRASTSLTTNQKPKRPTKIIRRVYENYILSLPFDGFLSPIKLFCNSCCFH